MSSPAQEIDGQSFLYEVAVKNHQAIGAPPPPPPNLHYSPGSWVEGPSESDLSSIHWSQYGMSKPTKTPRGTTAGPAPRASPLPQASSSSKLGKRSFAEYDDDLIDDTQPQDLLQSTPSLSNRNAALTGHRHVSTHSPQRVRASPARRTGHTTTTTTSLEQPDPVPAVRMIYGCFAYVSNTAQQGLGYFARLAAWFRPQPAPIEIVAIETPSGNKRRAVARVPGYFPTTPSAMLTPPDSRPTSSSESEKLQTNNAAFPQTPESRPTSAHSQEQIQEQIQEQAVHLSSAMKVDNALLEQQVNDVPSGQGAQETSSPPQNAQEAAEPSVPAQEASVAPEPIALQAPSLPSPPRRRPRMFLLQHKLDLEKRMEMEKQDQESRNRNRISYVPKSLPPARVQIPVLPPSARPPPQSPEDRQAQEDAKDKVLDDLCKRAEKVKVESPETTALMESFRMSKIRREIERSEREQRQAEAAAEARAQDEAIQAQIEEDMRLLDERKAEQARKVAEEAAKEAAKVDKDQLIRPLDPKWDQKVKEAMQAKNDQHFVAKTKDGVDLTKRDFGTLLPKEGQTHASAWLNDEIVNGWYSAMVEAKAKETGYVKGKGVPSIAAFQTAWYTTYKSKGTSGIARWSRRMGINNEKLLSADKVFFPINTGAHWMLMIISPKARTIEYLDSLCGSGKKYFQIAREWLAMELNGKYDAAEWTELNTRSSVQSNTDDCGAFTCLNGLAAAKGRSFQDVSAEKMQEARRMMGAVLLNGGFDGDWKL